GPGDEIVITDHEYETCRNAAHAWAARTGARVVEVPIPFPPTSPKVVVEQIVAAVGANTRLVIVDHVTSPTALVFPVEAIVAALGAGAPGLAGGSHAPGRPPPRTGAPGRCVGVRDPPQVGGAPQGAASPHVADRHVDTIQPLVVSRAWGVEAATAPRLHTLFDWTATEDPSARLAVPVALDTMSNAHPDGWDGVRSANRTLVIEGRRIVTEALGLDPGAGEAWIGSMAAVVLPGEPEQGVLLDELTVRLRHNHAIEVPVYAWRGRRLLRLSAQRYNRLDDYRRLVDALID